MRTHRLSMKTDFCHEQHVLMSPMTQTTVTDRRHNMIKTCFMTAKCQLTPHPWISDEHSVSVLYAEKCSKWLTDEKIQWLSGVLRLVPSTPLHCTLALILQVSWTLHRSIILCFVDSDREQHLTLSRKSSTRFKLVANQAYDLFHFPTQTIPLSAQHMWAS